MDRNNSDRMTLAEAFQLLGLPRHADASTIKSAFRRLAKVKHPDKQTGDAEFFLRLKAAQELALSSVETAVPLVVDQVRRQIQVIEQMVNAQAAQRRAVDEASGLRRRETRPFQRLKYFTLVLTAVTALLTWMGEDVLPVLQASDAGSMGRWKQVFMLLTLGFAGTAGMSHFFVQRIEHSIEDYLEHLGVKSACARELAHLLEYVDRDSVTYDALLSSQDESAYSPSLLRLPRAARQHSLSSVLIQKSIEHGLLVEIASSEVFPDSVPQFRVAFQPSLFRPVVSRQEVQPIIAADSKAGVVTAAAMTIAMIGLYLFLHLYIQTGWSIAALILAALFALGTLISIADWRAAVKRERGN